MEKLLITKEVLELTRLSYPTLYRLLNSGQFPPPVNGRGRKMLWHMSQIEDWAKYRQSTQDSNTTAVSPMREQKRQAKAFKERQAAAKASLDKHRITTTNPRKGG
jgi:predicted DNA-binding transcriptional regulator AlpA